MKAAVVEKPGLLTVREVPEPIVGDYDALCQLLYGATCTGTDQHLIHGRFPWPVAYPTILGHESIGRVIRTGAKIRHLRPGDLVTRVGATAPPDSGLHVNWGGFAQLGIARDHLAMREDGLPQDHWSGHQIHQVLPPDTDPAAATMVITWRETHSYLTRLGVGSGAGVLVLGSGGNGLAFASHARNAGASLVALVGSVGREGSARAAGAGVFVDYRADDLAKRLTQAAPEGFDFIIDAVGKAEQINRVLGTLKPGGKVAIYGIDDFGRCTINPQAARGDFVVHRGGYDEAEAHGAVVGLMRSGKLDARIWFTGLDAFPLERTGDAITAAAQRRAVKALVKLSPD